MKNLFVYSSLLLLSFSLQAEELVRAVSFAEIRDSGALHAGELLEGETLTVKAAANKQFQLLIELAEPGISAPVYALKGMIRYEGVEGDGYLQLDNHFGAKGTYFSKSLAMSGPLGKLSGSSDWRPFMLPFYANSGDQADGTSPVPEKLSLGLFLPGSGSVSIRGVGLYQYAAGEDPLVAAGQWVDGPNATLAGAVGGAVLGLWGGLIGVLAGLGKARRFVLGSSTVSLVLGIVSLVVGVVALGVAQPYSVYYPFLLIGIILVVVFGALRKSLARRYEQMELKRMRSMDV